MAEIEVWNNRNQKFYNLPVNTIIRYTSSIMHLNSGVISKGAISTHFKVVNWL